MERESADESAGFGFFGASHRRRSPVEFPRLEPSSLPTRTGNPGTAAANHDTPRLAGVRRTAETCAHFDAAARRASEDPAPAGEKTALPGKPAGDATK